MSLNNIIARLGKKITDKVSKETGSGAVKAPEMPILSSAHLSDKNGLQINHNKQVIASPIMVLEKVLEKNEGLVIGRLKRSFSDVEFITENMDRLARMGVTKIFCNFIAAEDQNMLDRYHLGEEMSDQIRAYIAEKYGKEQKGIELSTRVELYMRVIRAAKSFGIRVIGIDAKPSEDGDKTPIEPHMARIIRKFNEKIPGKSIVFAGAVA